MRARQIVISLLAAVAVAVTASAPAGAVPVEKDLNAAGDKLLTYDSVTGFEWLDLSATQFQSYAAVLASGFVTVDGFRHATATEVSALFAHFGATDQSGNFTADPAQVAAVLDIMAKLSCTPSPACAAGTYPGSAFTQGWAEIDPADPNFLLAPYAQLFGGAQSKVTCFTVGSGCAPFDKSTALAGFGHFLVRTADIEVPEPAALALFGLGLAGLGAIRRKRRA